MKNFTYTSLVLGLVRTNCYILSAPATGETYIFDPDGPADQILEHLTEDQRRSCTILLTHGHFDHMGAAKELQLVLNADVYIHTADQELLLGNVPGLRCAPPPERCSPFTKGKAWPFAGRHITFLHTPGHTPGSVCYLFDNLLFSGDTLFKDCIGRTDLPGGCDADMKRSLLKIISLQGEYAVFPGHGPATSLDDERGYNPYFFTI